MLQKIKAYHSIGHVASFALLLLYSLPRFGCALEDASSDSPSEASKRFLSTSPPNVILILVDDLGLGDLGSYGGRIIQTPRLDRMAQRGLRFSDYYVAAPVCSPSRAATFSGQFPQRFGLWHNAMGYRSPLIMKLELSAPSLPDVFGLSDYKRIHIGKWHLGDSAPFADRGFDVYRTPAAAQKNFPSPAEDPHYTASLTSEAISQIATSVREGRRFLLNLWYLSPHAPLIDPPEPTPFDKYYDKALGVTKSDQKSYARMVSYLDAQIGRILDYLDEHELSRNTLVLFASDNGGTQYTAPLYSNGPYKLGKTSVFEGGVRSPMIVQWVGRIPPGALSASPIHGVDILPTLADLLGVLPNANDWDGTSFLDELLDPQSSVTQRSLHWEVKGIVPASDQGDWTGPTDHWAIQKIQVEHGRIARWKLVFDTRWGFRLYELTRDPLEVESLLRPEASPEILRRREQLVAEHSAWKQRVGRIPLVTSIIEGDAMQYGRDYRFSGHGRIWLAQDSRMDLAENLSFSFIAKPEAPRSANVTLLTKANSWKLSMRPDGRLQFSGKWIPLVIDEEAVENPIREISFVSRSALHMGESNRVILCFHTYAQSDQSGSLIRLYVNGDETRALLSEATQGRTGGTIVASNTSALVLAGDGYIGTLGEMSSFSYALDKAEVLRIMQSDEHDAPFHLEPTGSPRGGPNNRTLSSP